MLNVKWPLNIKCSHSRIEAKCIIYFVIFFHKMMSDHLRFSVHTFNAILLLSIKLEEIISPAKFYLSKIGVVMSLLTSSGRLDLS